MKITDSSVLKRKWKNSLRNMIDLHKKISADNAKQKLRLVIVVKVRRDVQWRRLILSRLKTIISNKHCQAQFFRKRSSTVKLLKLEMWSSEKSQKVWFKEKQEVKLIDWLIDWLIDFLKIDTVCAARENERVCRYVRKKVYFIRTESLNRDASTCVFYISKGLRRRSDIA